MADIILFPGHPPKKTEDDYTWFIHECVNVEFFLRSDGFIVCTKCGEEIGYYTLYGHD